MIKKVLVTVICICSLIVCCGCDKDTTGNSKETSVITSTENVSSMDVIVKPNHTDRIVSAEQKDIYEDRKSVV